MFSFFYLLCKYWILVRIISWLSGLLSSRILEPFLSIPGLYWRLWIFSNPSLNFFMDFCFFHVFLSYLFFFHVGFSGIYFQKVIIARVKLVWNLSLEFLFLGLEFNILCSVSYKGINPPPQKKKEKIIFALEHLFTVIMIILMICVDNYNIKYIFPCQVKTNSLVVSIFTELDFPFLKF